MRSRQDGRWTQWRTYYTRTSGYLVVWGTIYAAILVLASALFFYDIPLPDNRLTLSRVQFTESNADRPAELAGQSWQQVELPDDWRQRSSLVSNLWYRGHIALNVSPERLWAVLIPALRMNAAVYLNGALLGNGGRFDDPVARNWMTPQIYFIPNGLLRSGDNLIQVRVKSDPLGSGQLSRLEFAPYEDLLKAYDIHYLLRITSIEMGTVILLIMGGLIAILWFVRRSETYYGYYSLAVIVWALHNLNIFVINIPFGTRYWDWFVFFSIGVYTVICAIFVHRFLPVERPRIERLMLIVGGAGGMLLLIVDPGPFYWYAYNVWYPAVFALGFYVFSTVFIAAWRQRSTDLQFIAATGLVIILYAAHDMLVINGLADWQDGYFIQYGAAILLTFFSAIMVRRFASSLNTLDTLSQNLERRVEEKHLQLEKNFDRIRQMERQRVIAVERERLSRDMHDGLGGHLVSTLAMIDTGKADLQKVSTAIRDSLNDLRLMIDSMEMGEDDLPTLLGMFRLRIEPQLQTNDIELVWRVEDLPPIPGFGPREALHILRILQEAIANAIRHAAPKRIELSAGVDQQCHCIRIRVRDNGDGIAEKANAGHGLSNMRHRAITIGAELSIASGPDGTTIDIAIPMGSSQPGD